MTTGPRPTSAPDTDTDRANANANDAANDEAFLTRVTAALAALPGVRAVTLGGSRAQGTHRPDSDWDFAIYYRGSFDPEDLRRVGRPGEVSELGGWGGGVFNGGAWLQIDGRPVDVHYRDLDSVEHQLAEAEVGRFGIEPLMFHLAGIPTYLVVAELAINQVLHGDLPRPSYPAALRETAPDVWWDRSRMTFGYALDNHAAGGRSVQCAGLVAQAASQAAHAVLAARGEWVTNEKTLLTRAGLDPLNELTASFRPDPAALRDAVGAARSLAEQAVRRAVA
jgi:predicted nucleotidyltransferase